MIEAGHKQRHKYRALACAALGLSMMGLGVYVFLHVHRFGGMVLAIGACAALVYAKHFVAEARRLKNAQ